MAVVTELDRKHPIAAELLDAVIAIRRGLAKIGEFESLRSEAIGTPAIGAEEVTRLLGVTANPQAFSDRMAKMKTSTTTMAEVNEFVKLCVPAAAV